MTETLFNPENGIGGLIEWLGASTEGLFFVFMIIAIYIIFSYPAIVRYGFDWSMFGISFGCLLISLPIYYMRGFGVGYQADIILFIQILIFALITIKIILFKE